MRENCVFYILRMYEFLHNQGQTRRSKQHHYSISSSARTTRHVEAECLGGFEIDCEGVTARRPVAGQFECALYENRADARGGSDDENSHCSNGCRDLGKCDIRRANHGGCALRRLRGRRQRTAGRCAPGYVYYPAYGEPLPGPNCNWFRMPVYDVFGNMVGWRGRPVAFCSWLAGYRPWPLP